MIYSLFNETGIDGRIYCVASTGGITSSNNNICDADREVQISTIPILEKRGKYFRADGIHNYDFGSERLLNITTSEAHRLRTGTFFKNGRVYHHPSKYNFLEDTISIDFRELTPIDDIDFNCINEAFPVKHLKNQIIYKYAKNDIILYIPSWELYVAFFGSSNRVLSDAIKGTTEEKLVSNFNVNYSSKTIHLECGSSIKDNDKERMLMFSLSPNATQELKKFRRKINFSLHYNQINFDSFKPLWNGFFTLKYTYRTCSFDTKPPFVRLLLHINDFKASPIKELGFKIFYDIPNSSSGDENDKKCNGNEGGKQIKNTISQDSKINNTKNSHSGLLTHTNKDPNSNSSCFDTPLDWINDSKSTKRQKTKVVTNYGDEVEEVSNQPKYGSGDEPIPQERTEAKKENLPSSSSWDIKNCMTFFENKFSKFFKIINYEVRAPDPSIFYPKRNNRIRSSHCFTYKAISQFVFIIEIIPKSPNEKFSLGIVILSPSVLENNEASLVLDEVLIQLATKKVNYIWKNMKYRAHGRIETVIPKRHAFPKESKLSKEEELSIKIYTEIKNLVQLQKTSLR